MPQPSSTKKILIVEDEKALSKAMELKLKSAGFIPEAVFNGEEAIKSLMQNKYNLMILDLIMPVMDGFSVLKELKERNITIPVIVASNLGQPEDLKRAKELGAEHYFIKSSTSLNQIVDQVKLHIS